MVMESGIAASATLLSAAIPLIRDFIKSRKEKRIILTETDDHVIEGEAEDAVEEEGEKFIVVHFPDCTTMRVPFRRVKSAEFVNTPSSELLESLQTPRWDNAKGYLRDHDDASAIVEELYDKGALTLAELTDALRRAGYETPRRFVRRRVEQLVNLGIVRPKDVLRYELHEQARENLLG